MILSTVCSCGISGKPQVDEQTIHDPIENALRDSLGNAEEQKAKSDSIQAYNEIHSKTVVERELMAFLSEYVNNINDNIRQDLSSDLSATIKKWEPNAAMTSLRLQFI